MPIMVRENPMFFERIEELKQFQTEMTSANLLQIKDKGQRVRALGKHIVVYGVHVGVPRD